MKPLHVALLCAACCFGAAGTSYLLFETLHEPPRESAAPVAVDDDAPTIVNEDPRIAELERQVARLEDRLVVMNEQRRTPDPDKTALISKEEDSGQIVVIKTVIEELQAEIEALRGEASAGAAWRSQAVTDLTSENRRTRLGAARLLGNLAQGGDEAAKQALLDALNSDNTAVRLDALEGMATSGLVDFMPALKEAMKDNDPGVRREVAETLRSMPIEDAAPVLMSMLRDSDPRVLREAVDALGDKGYEAAAGDIRPLTAHQDQRVALEASIALKRAGDPSAAEVWVTNLGTRLNGDNVNDRRFAVSQLRRMRLQSARPFLEQAAQDKDSRVRRDAQRALRELDQ